MKLKFHLFVTFFLFLYFQDHAQSFRAGLNTGLVASEINGTTVSGHFRKVGMSLGLLVNREISKKDLFQLELNFIQKGSFTPGDSLGNGRSKIALSYIEIPVLFRHKIHFIKNGRSINRVDLEAGGSYGRMFSYYTVNETNTILHQSKNLLNYNDISFLVGFDVNITPNFVFNVRYSNSVIPAIKRNTPNVQFITYTFNRGNNQVLLFSLKFMFGPKPAEAMPEKPKEKTEDQDQ